ncbi:hypothetical protein KIN20_027383 [Parelaphostrongylus tenuis]|uniref:Uncharacterized protein n=1 Tax=Parelaphostrongylus tenuis TaxID=148309 RepID=A0AAD5QZH5_PARTN|nr:hypothetical protein KIN20_027383 [Parelaphostrongylus tenuis]
MDRWELDEAQETTKTTFTLDILLFPDLFHYEWRLKSMLRISLPISRFGRSYDPVNATVDSDAFDEFVYSPSRVGSSRRNFLSLDLSAPSKISNDAANYGKPGDAECVTMMGLTAAIMLDGNYCHGRRMRARGIDVMTGIEKLFPNLIYFQQERFARFWILEND